MARFIVPLLCVTLVVALLPVASARPSCASTSSRHRSSGGRVKPYGRPGKTSSYQGAVIGPYTNHNNTEAVKAQGVDSSPSFISLDDAGAVGGNPSEQKPSSTEAQPEAEATPNSSVDDTSSPPPATSPPPNSPPSEETQNTPPDEENSSGGNGGGSSGGDIAQYLDAHNGFRAQHGAGPLSWSDDLASKAQSWANTCQFEHSGGALGPFGENLAAGTGSNFDIAIAVQGWKDEAPEYDPANPQASHFTQVVWKATTELGCGMAICDGIFDPKFGKAKYFVCEYSVAGNVRGQFGENVE